MHRSQNNHEICCHHVAKMHQIQIRLGSLRPAGGAYSAPQTL